MTQSISAGSLDPANQSNSVSNGRKLSKKHWKVVLVAGMGFFTDAYDLFIIGVVTAILIPLWHLSVWQVAILNGASLVAAAFGAIAFGWISDRLGRKNTYGYEILLLFFSALASAFSTSFGMLLILRGSVGFAVGGDYPSSAVVSAEHSNKHNRGFLVLMVFAMQAVGLIVGPCIASGLLALNMPMDLVWRVLLGIGAVPAISVFFMRRKLYAAARAKEKAEEELRINEQYRFEGSVAVDKFLYNTKPESGSNAITLKPFHIFAKHKKSLFGTAMSWFLFDVAFYGNSVSSVLILKRLIPDAALISKTLITALIFLVFAFPGYIAAAKFVDRVGRKRMQILGFFIMALCFALMSLLNQHWLLFVALFGISFFFVNFGPNATTFLIPSEIFPEAIRASAHGISAAAGKVGAFVGAFFMPVLLAHLGLGVTFCIVCAVCLLGVLTTLVLPEMKSGDLL